MRKTAIFVLLVLFAMLAMPAASAATMTVVADPPQVFSCDPVPIPVTINVTDTSTGTPIDGANVTFRGTYWSTSNITTNGECTFYVNNPYDPNGKFWVDANATGYDNVIGIEIPIYPYHGYKGKSYTCGPDMTTWKTYDLNGNLVYSVGDSYYLSSSATSGDPDWTAYDVAWTASDLPVTGTIKEARLYTTYTWDKGVIPTYVSLSFNGVAQTPDAHYSDEKGWGTSYPYGMLAYDVTSDFNPSGNYANLTNSYTGGDNVSMRGMVLMVIYEDASEPARQIYINEEFDLLYGGSSYYTTPEEATAWAPITGPAIDMAGVVSARLITVAPGAGAHGNGKTPVEGDLIFNGQIWTDAWDFAGIGDAAATETEIGIDERDVTSYLQSTDNLVGIRSDGDWMEASNAILVVEMEASVGTFTGSGTAYFESSAGTIEDLTAIAEETLPAAGGKPNLLFPHGFFSFNITGLTFGQTASVTITLPDNVPVGTQYWKYLASTASWTQIPMTSVDDGDNVIVIHLTDGGAGDDDGVQNGVIVDPGSVGVEGIVYFEPEDIRLAKQGDTTNVSIWVDTSVALSGGIVVFDYTCCCANVTAYYPNTTNWNQINNANIGTCGTVTIGFSGDTEPGPGLVHIGDFTIECCGGSYCETDLVWNTTIQPGSPPKIPGIGDLNGDLIPADWDDGTFKCNIPDLIVCPTMKGNEINATHYNVTCTVKNSGAVNASASTANLLVDDSQVATMSVPELGPGGEFTGTFALEIALTDGADELEVCADYDGMVVELDETNNCMTGRYPGEVVISIQPVDTFVQPQDQFDVKVYVDTKGMDVYAVQYRLTYNTSVVRAETQNKDTFLGPLSETMIIVNEIDQPHGEAFYAETRKDVSSGVNESDNVTNIHFIAIGVRGATTALTLDDITISDENGVAIAYITEPGTVEITTNTAPVANGTSKHRTNNVAQKYQCISTICSCSYDLDYPGKGGNITYIRWAFGDGQYGTSEGLPIENCTCKEHKYESWQWQPFGTPYEDGGRYVPFDVQLEVTDDGCPELTNNSIFTINVYIAGDANGDGEVNVLDAVWVGKYWREECGCDDCLCEPCYDYLWANEQADGADLNNDCEINVLDAVIIGANWRHVAW